MSQEYLDKYESWLLYYAHTYKVSNWIWLYVYHSTKRYVGFKYTNYGEFELIATNDEEEIDIDFIDKEKFKGSFAKFLELYTEHHLKSIASKTANFMFLKEQKEEIEEDATL